MVEREGGRYASANSRRPPWPAGFPEVLALASYNAMINHPNYRAAKDGTDEEGALDLIFDLAENAPRGLAMDRLQDVIGDRWPIVVAVHAEEAAGRNKIPMAYAAFLEGAAFGLTLDEGIVQTNVVDHTNAPSIYHRMTAEPTFEGKVEASRAYLIVDDTMTAGATLAALRGFVESQGGSVIGASIVASPIGNLEISLSPSTLRRLQRKHPGLDDYWQETFGWGLQGLTEGEAGHLLASPDLGEIRRRISEAR